MLRGDPNGNPKKEDAYSWFILLDKQKLTQHCKATILQLLKKE